MHFGKFLLAACLFFAESAYAGDYDVQCKDSGLFAHGRSASFDGDTGILKFRFSSTGASSGELEVLDLFAIPARKLLTHQHYLLVAKFDPEACQFPESPYAFEGLLCNRMVGLTLHASDRPYWNSGWEHQYRKNVRAGKLRIDVKSRQFNWRFRSVDFDLTLDGKDFTSWFGNVCGSPCSRNSVVMFPPLNPRPSSCDRRD